MKLESNPKRQEIGHEEAIQGRTNHRLSAGSGNWAAGAELCRPHGFSGVSYYLWRSKFGGMSVSAAKRLKELEAENMRLKKLLAESILENEITKEALRKKWWAHHHDVIWCAT